MAIQYVIAKEVVKRGLKAVAKNKKRKKPRTTQETLDRIDIRKNPEILLDMAKKSKPKRKRPKKQPNKVAKVAGRVAGIQAGVKLAEKNKQRKKKKALEKARAKRGPIKTDRKPAKRTPRKYVVKGK
tara:strand:+ start:316 stop:696 length:381 start_codon:yes stop_codon:yes gene_type:complete